MSKQETASSLQAGVETIGGYVRSLPDTPGVYRMLSASGDALYVGKAKSLKKRVSSYTKIDKQPIRLQRMIALTRSMEFVNTHTEVEALLLESNLIKKLKPRYNVLLRDDKSFPYILLTGDHDFAQVMKHRGAKKRKGQYFGPFAGAGDVNRTIAILQRVFMLRNCSDSYFFNRSRPCLQYHIKRCTAPCVEDVSKAAYQKQVSGAKDFLEGRSQKIQNALAKDMQAASDKEDYEGAALLRDRIKALTFVQARQDINVSGVTNADVLGVYRAEGKSCVQIFFFRAGRNYGNRSYFPRHDKEESAEAILSAFIAQFYENKPVPKEIIVSHDIEERGLLEEALSSKAGVKVKITKPVRGTRKRLQSFVVKNAREALARHQASLAGQGALLSGVAELFSMDDPPSRIEVYDNSHISGTNMVGGMIVAGVDGFRKNAYRKFNIKKAAAADDTGMMREVLERRFIALLKQQIPPSLEGGGKGEGEKVREGENLASGEMSPHPNPLPGGRGDDYPEWPDLLLIDGGQGQFNAVHDVLEDLGILGDVTLVSIAKGPDRNAGRERFFMEGKKPFQLPVNDPVLYYLQRLRDEAHRFAIGSHRTRRTKQISASPLDEIAGIGAKRKKALLHHFGSAKEVAKAGIEDLEKVDGVSRAIAETIYNHFHEK